MIDVLFKNFILGKHNENFVKDKEADAVYLIAASYERLWRKNKCPKKSSNLFNW